MKEKTETENEADLTFEGNLASDGHLTIDCYSQGGIRGTYRVVRRDGLGSFEVLDRGLADYDSAEKAASTL